ncbi:MULTISPECIES: aldo/keto reductase [Bacillus]|uniref:Aldo/keto reductase n=2 Tax=Bacillus TaxID=1386 RepID=A0A0M4FRH7_9BACI|nr:MULTISPECIES: aldo/keto reductase [Bacillus]ALC82135.1 aldo/keto reductase [Bacillus gobiensis]MBP1084261.1 putative oxidoreductase [Bacillus capparidis]MED1095651.1 aldo/keto reductase [Bacillus capparidis]
MKITTLKKREITDNRLVLGCMGFGGNWDSSPISNEDIVKAEQAIDAALAAGITMFDHADIYRMGKAEEVFGNILASKPGLREQIIVQSKCGIRFEDEGGPFRYDFSKEHILTSVDRILQRLQTEYIDILLLHRPDPLMEPEEVAEAFQQLKSSGKVRHFGVSNMNKAQIQLLQAYCNDPIIVNQLEMNLRKLDWVDHGVLVNHESGAASHFSDGLLEHCILNDIQIQGWSPLANGIYSGNEIENMNEADKQTKELVKKLASEKETSIEAIILGWLMRHPAKIQPVIGTTNPDRIRNCRDAIRQSELMTREEWYSLYVSARGAKLP